MGLRLPKLSTSLLLLALFSLTLTNAQSASTLSCKPYRSHPLASSPDKYRIRLIGEGYNPDGSLRFYNLSAHTPLQAANPSAPSPSNLGTAFRFNTCNSTSLNLSSSKFPYTCEDGGCQIGWQDYLQVVDPATGLCMTWDHPKAAVSNISFQACQTAPTTYAQLWNTEQAKYYSSNGGGPVFLSATLRPVFDAEKTEFDFTLEKDNVTVTVRPRNVKLNQNPVGYLENA